MEYKLALIGHPVSHSISPEIHSDFLRQANLIGSYHAIDCQESDLPTIIKDLQYQGYRGINVTVPHKEVILSLATEQSKAVQKIGAANTLIFEDQNIIAENTDYIGWWNSIQDSCKKSINTALIIGAGGSARAVVMALSEFSSVEHIVFLVRPSESSISKAQNIINNFEDTNIQFSIIHEDNLKEYSSTDIIVNTSPVGMSSHGSAESPLPERYLQSLQKALVYDLIYSPAWTQLLEDARKHGHIIQNGKAMLYLQAAESFRLWTGFVPSIQNMV